MIIEGERFTFEDTFDTPITVADSWVMPKNKLGDGNGEAKLYFGSRDKMEQFFGDTSFSATCFVLRQDLQAYMQAIKAEYFTPSQDYRRRDEMRILWSERMEKINALPPGIVIFTVREQSQIAQDEYRRKLLEECPFCPITMINEESLLIASHIKPWAVSDSVERIDPNNGFILSPLYDKLFDRGYITFSNDKRVSISNWLSRQVKERIGIKENQFFQFLPINDARIRYLEYHRSTVFKG